ncbi:hypothetical protein [Asticcacaulis solisilvae]|uniref:hypothetical protein n=1 Tax=Asticcacaulis solisilvae TaxID=1217274 RepID=UPI003FD6D0AB
MKELRIACVAMMLVLAGCDAGPSAVVHDGDGKGVSDNAKPSPQAVAAAPRADAEASMAVIDGAPPEPEPALAAAPAHDHTDAPHYGTALKTGMKADISDSAYGDWPLWSSNRKYSADDNAHYQFEKHGPEFGAKSYEQYVAMAHAFVHTPPPGTETLKRRNGDTLFYDGKGNVFAVMTKKGAPRTVFRPDEGRAYWDKQKDIEAAKAAGRDDDAG